VPSAAQPDPGTDEYFNGGYNTARYGSRDGGNISGFQIETNNVGVRDTQANRLIFANAVVDVFSTWLERYSGIDILP
jgi:hypothetical protein